MTTDILADMGHLFLGSRLKRLAERFQAGAAKSFRDAGHAVQPGQMPLLAALHSQGPLTIGALVEAVGVSQPAITRNLAGLVAMGLAESSVSKADRRQKTIALTTRGASFVATVSARLWPRIDAAVTAMCAPLHGPLLGQVAALEAALAAAPLEARVAALSADKSAPAAALELVDFSDALADDFRRINAEWIAAMYTMEATDHDVLDNPRARIIDRGGAILYARAGDLGIVGTCALMPLEPGVFELTKMGVSASARGRKVGEFLLAGVIDRARQMQMQTLFLLTNRKSQAAIHLYEKRGFIHDADIMARYGRKYERCNVAMRFPLESGERTATAT
jgi:DNA-binding MarR family transcriptional regulator